MDGGGKYQWVFKFSPDGGLNIQYKCSEASFARGEGTGKWWVDRNWLCLDSDLPAFQITLGSDEACWNVGRRRNRFAAYDYSNETVFSKMAFAHPNHSSTKTLVAALRNIRGPAVMQATVPAPLASSLAEDLTAWRAIQNSMDIAQIQGYLKAFPQGQFATVAAIKIEQLAMLMASKQQQELRAWQAIEGSTNKSDYAGYLARYPDGMFAGPAKSRMASIRAQPAPPTASQELAKSRAASARKANRELAL